MSKLTYEEWKTQNPTTIADGVIESLKMFHGVDAEKEVEELMRQEYEVYCKEYDD
jgi:uncharacterized protein YijF (DUF1287 family)